MTPRLPPPQSQPLTDSEVEQLRAVLAQDAYVKRFWASIRAWVLAIAAILAAVTVGAETISKALAWIRGK